MKINPKFIYYFGLILATLGYWCECFVKDFGGALLGASVMIIYILLIPFIFTKKVI